MHKKAAETISNKKQPVKQNQKSSYQKEITNSTKTTASHNNPAKKVKTKTNTNKQKKKEVNLSLESDTLSLHPNATSENEDIMSIASDSSAADTFI